MSDERLRALQRRFAESGAPEDEALLLRERLRLGAVTAEGLELAAHLEHRGAALALEREPERGQELSAWVAHILLFGRGPFLRALEAALRAALPAVAREPRVEATRILEALASWTRDPGALGPGSIPAPRPPSLGETVALRANPAARTIVDACLQAARLTETESPLSVRLPTGLRVGTHDTQARFLEGRIRQAGTCLRLVPADGRYAADVFACGRLGPYQLTRLFHEVSPLAPVELVARLRRVAERAAPAVYAARLVGEERVRAAIRAQLLPAALGGSPGG